MIRLAVVRSSLKRIFPALAVTSIRQAKARLYVVKRAGRFTSCTHVLEDLLREIDILHVPQCHARSSRAGSRPWYVR